ncbi:MAG: hypothetical protein R3F34_09165 [Planctomycetota bacterium]
MRRLLVPFALCLAATACASDRLGSPKALPVAVAPPVQNLSNAYETATKITLPAQKPAEYSDLHNVYRLSDTIITGSEPHGEAAIERLSQWGVKTILSVDGKAPDAETAAKYGIRYVHVPIQYKGMTPEQEMEIVKTFRELEGPFYVHCFHGKHRGPAGAALGRLVLDGVSREQALAEMRQWCGTSSKYSGLYWSVASAELPTEAESRAYRFDFHSAAPLEGIGGAMVPISRAFENVDGLAGDDYAIDPSHPDIDPVNEAEILADYFARANGLDEVAAEPEDFRQWMADSVKASSDLLAALREVKTGEAGAVERANGALDWVKQSCSACHSKYRNR